MMTSPHNISRPPDRALGARQRHPINKPNTLPCLVSLELSRSTNSSILGERSSSLEEKWSNHVAVAGHQAGAKDGQEGLIEPAATAPQEDAETEEQQARGKFPPAPLPGLHALDHALGPPSTPAEIFRRTCLFWGFFLKRTTKNHIRELRGIPQIWFHLKSFLFVS